MALDTETTRVVTRERRLAQTPRPSRLKETATILYLAMALLLLADPGAVADRLSDLPQNWLTERAAAAIGVVAEASERLGLTAAREALRGQFLKLTERPAR